MRSNLGHRQRVKQRFRDEGLGHFEESHALELLLFYAVPRRDTKPIARRLLDAFGSYSKVLEADMAALCKVEGVGESVATYIKLLHASYRYYHLNKNVQPQSFHNTEEYAKYLIALYHGLNKEQVHITCLNAKGELIFSKLLAEGTVTSVDIPIRRLMDISINCGAVSVILSHNHPDGLLKGSPEDVACTRRVAKALLAAEIRLIDHVLVSGDDYVSLLESGFYDFRGGII